jgi:hypothetical protein
MDSVIAFALATLASAGASAVLLAILGWLLRSWIGERLRASIKHEYDDRLEKLKAELKSQGDGQLASLKSEMDRQAEKLRIASASFAEMQKATVTKKIEAVDDLWQTIISGRKSLPDILQLLDRIDIPRLDGKALANVTLMADAFDSEQAVTLVNDLFGDVQKHRPFLGEPIWTMFSIYQSILCRILYLLALDPENPNRLTWYMDEEAQRLINLGFGEDFLEEMQSLKVGRMNSLRERFERSILDVVNKLLTGQEFGAEALAHASRISEEISKIRT